MTTEITQGSGKPDSKMPFQIKANLKLYAKRLGYFRPLLAFAITFIALVRWGFVAWLATILVLGAIIGLGIFLLSRRTVTLTNDSIEYRNTFGYQKVAYSEIESAIYFQEFHDAAFGYTTRLSISVKNGKSPINLTGFYWLSNDTAKLAENLEKKNVSVELYDEYVAFNDIAKQYPRHASYLELHQGRVAIIAIIGIFVVVAAIAYFITVN